MSRPLSKGLDWYQTNVGEYTRNNAMRKLRLKFGPLGEAVYFRLLDRIYDSSYYIQLPFSDLAESICEAIGTKWASHKKILDVILFCFEVELFSNNFISDSVITSESIQRTFVRATKKRKQKIVEYCLLAQNEIESLRKEESVLQQKEPVTATETPVTATETPVTATETKGQDSRVKNLIPNIRQTQSSTIDQAQPSCVSSKNSIKTVEEFSQVWPNLSTGKEEVPAYADLEKIHMAVKNSPQFLQVRVSLGLKWMLKHENYLKVVCGAYENISNKHSKSTTSPKIEARKYAEQELAGLFTEIKDIKI